MSRLPGFSAEQSIFRSSMIPVNESKSTNSTVQAQWCPSWIPGCTCSSRCDIAFAACTTATSGAGYAACVAARIACKAYCNS